MITSGIRFVHIAMIWHVLDVGSIWMKEFGAALGRQVPAMCWLPVISNTALFESWRADISIANPSMTVRTFPLQRGYARWPMSAIARIGRHIPSMLREHDLEAESSPLICSTPYLAPVAESWPGPVIYYQTDMTVKYHGVNPNQVRSLDRRLCRVATAVCVNSQRIADYMVAEAGCELRKITVVPNATRASNVFKRCPEGPLPAPSDISDLPRPLAGVIGNLAANMDWIFLRDLVAGTTPAFSWVFVGPTQMPVYDLEQARAREDVMRLGGRVRFVGSKPYGALRDYARSLDVAVLPYLGKEPTYSGSSTRFYEHLAACRPMISTRGFEELLHKEPLLGLADSAQQAIALLEQLRRSGFRDGFQQMRWTESLSATWENRAATIVSSIEQQAEKLMTVKSSAA